MTTGSIKNYFTFVQHLKTVIRKYIYYISVERLCKATIKKKWLDIEESCPNEPDSS